MTYSKDSLLPSEILSSQAASKLKFTSIDEELHDTVFGHKKAIKPIKEKAEEHE